jgi:TrmH family RNA methyltransferase
MSNRQNIKDDRITLQLHSSRALAPFIQHSHVPTVSSTIICGTFHQRLERKRAVRSNAAPLRKQVMRPGLALFAYRWRARLATIRNSRVSAFNTTPFSCRHREPVHSFVAPARRTPPNSAMLTKAEIQRLRSLREKKHREELGLFVVEGEKVVGELLNANFPFEEIYATDAWLEVRTALAESAHSPSPRPEIPPHAANPTAARVVAITPDEMSRASHYPTPSSVLAVGKIRRTPLVPGGLNEGLTLALDGVQDPGNVGTLLRVADWFALDRVLLSPNCADLFHQKVINASMGSFARVKVHTTDLAAAFEDTTHLSIIGCDLAGESVHAVGSHSNAVIVIGSEGHGISNEVREYLTQTITIPRYGGAESLNAGIAAAIVCDNLRRMQ